jgi:hypothetical protein
MEDARVNDEFRRIRVTAQLSRDREMINQYEIGLAFHQQRVEDARYDLGRLDEGLGGSSEGRRSHRRATCLVAR